jgi:hypothetical protein
MSEEAGFQIGKRLYPFPIRFRLGDPVIVEQLTGLTWPQFVERLPDEDDDPSVADDPIATLGMLAIAISQTNPTWRRDRVIRYVSDLDMDDVQIVGPSLEDDVEEDDANPPAVNGAPISSESALPSRLASESPSVVPSPPTSGIPASAT